MADGDKTLINIKDKRVLKADIFTLAELGIPDGFIVAEDLSTEELVDIIVKLLNE